MSAWGVRQRSIYFLFVLRWHQESNVTQNGKSIHVRYFQTSTIRVKSESLNLRLPDNCSTAELPCSLRSNTNYASEYRLARKLLFQWQIETNSCTCLSLVGDGSLKYSRGASKGLCVSHNLRLVYSKRYLPVVMVLQKYVDEEECMVPFASQMNLWQSVQGGIVKPWAHSLTGCTTILCRQHFVVSSREFWFHYGFRWSLKLIRITAVEKTDWFLSCIEITQCYTSKFL